MLTKIDAINLIQIELASGKMTADLRGKYPIPVISRWLGAVFAELAQKNTEAKSATSIEYEYNVVDKKVQLSPRPMSGISSFMFIKDEKREYRLRNPSTANMYDRLYGGELDYSATYTSKGELKFSNKPQGTVTVSYVPNIYEMSDTDMIVATGSERLLIDLTIDLMRKNNVMPTEKLNNNVPDAG